MASGGGADSFSNFLVSLANTPKNARDLEALIAKKNMERLRINIQVEKIKEKVKTQVQNLKLKESESAAVQHEITVLEQELAAITLQNRPTNTSSWTNLFRRT